MAKKSLNDISTTEKNLLFKDAMTESINKPIPQLMGKSDYDKMEELLTEAEQKTKAKKKSNVYNINRRGNTNAASAIV